MDTAVKGSKEETEDSQPINTRSNAVVNAERFSAVAHFVKIRPGSSWFTLDLKELWAYRELLYFLVWRDVKVRYKQTMLGVMWALLQPLLTMAIFSLLFGKLAGIPSDNIPYPLFAFCGLLPWTFINTAINSSSNSLVNNTNLITKVYFPRLLVPIAAAGAALVDLSLSSIVLVFIMFYYRIEFHLGILFAPFFLLLTLLLALGVGTLLSSLNVRFRDVKQLLPFGLQIWMFISPVFYPSSLFPEKWRWIIAFNPLTGILEGLRASLFGKPFDFFAVALSIATTILIILIGLSVFRRMEDDFADYV